VDINHYLLLSFWGLFSGLLAGVFGIGGGIVLVPIIKTFGYSPVQAVATSSLAIIMTSLSGSWQNWRMGNLDLKRVILLAIPAIFTAQIGAWFADYIQPSLLLGSFSIFLLFNIFLSQIKKNIISSSNPESVKDSQVNPFIARTLTGGLSGLLAGFFGIGGGVILVPMQILLLQEKIKAAIQISLGVIVITSISACTQHYLQGNILFIEGLILGLGGLVGAQISTRFLPKLSDRFISFGFNFMLGILSVYLMYQALTIYYRG
jgi:uncharacterized protein